MKLLFKIILISSLISSCTNHQGESGAKKDLEETIDSQKEEDSHRAIHENMDKVSIELMKFDNLLVKLYAEGEIKPNSVILKADSLIKAIEIETDPIKSQVKSNMIRPLHYLKAELFYKLELYTNSIDEIHKSKFKTISGTTAIALASNYVKMNNLDKAKSYIDSVGKSIYIYDYILGNYYECNRNIKGAIKIYRNISEDKSIRHYTHYKWSTSRLKELEKKEPELLNEIYFPTGHPSFQISFSDNENRDKIFEIISSIPEVDNCTECNSTWIYESPQENDKDYYWVKVGDGHLGEQITTFNFLVYVETFEIKYFDPKTKKIFELSEWRKLK